ncbi:hypothetical protein AAFF_G00079020 [Aldrovandia affinis]|uniref:Uncharacterized protein n=1 Tax=Aldrovandia affinis TaxID=143900 RepID=A0AAD7WCG1_9TELE|nr:hypothetical protein AAFF_G00079020 [Aldrovandia affinis]
MQPPETKKQKIKETSASEWEGRDSLCWGSAITQRFDTTVRSVTMGSDYSGLCPTPAPALGFALFERAPCVVGRGAGSHSFTAGSAEYNTDGTLTGPGFTRQPPANC